MRWFQEVSRNKCQDVETRQDYFKKQRFFKLHFCYFFYYLHNPPLSRSDDDIIFEDFARQRLIGAKDDEDEEIVDSPKPDDR